MKSAIFAAVAIIASSATYATPSQLSYSYTVPYSGGATLTIANTGNTPVTLTSLQFTTNAAITGSPYGTLWGWQSKLTKVATDEVNTQYSITETPAITIAPQQSATLTYAVDAKQSGGPFAPYNVAMNPSSVSVTLKDSTTPIIVPIKGMCTGAACNDPGNGKRIMGYYPNWAYWRTPKFTAEKIPYDKVNSVAYAFSIFDKNGAVSLYDQDSDAVNLPIISAARQQHPYLNASLSFGGWSWASTPPGWECETGASPVGPAACFSKMTENPAAMARFITGAVKAMKEVNFNGIDIDWEYPQVADSDHYVALLQGLRNALDAEGKKDNTHYFLTVATGAGIDKIRSLSKSQWQAVAAAVDYIDVMTYDFHGSWDQGQGGSNFMSAMKLDPANDKTANDAVLGKYNVTDAMTAYQDVGINSKKLVVGVPMYGRMMTIESAGNTKGLYQKITGTPQGEWDNSQSGYTGMLGYNCLVDQSTCGNNFRPGNLMLVDPTESSLGQYALTPWAYSNNVFVTYDDVNSATYKAKWVQENNYAGVMLWDFTGDFPAADQRSIVNGVYQQFKSR